MQVSATLKITEACGPHAKINRLLTVGLTVAITVVWVLNRSTFTIRADRDYWIETHRLASPRWKTWHILPNFKILIWIKKIHKFYPPLSEFEREHFFPHWNWIFRFKIEIVFSIWNSRFKEYGQVFPTGLFPLWNVLCNVPRLSYRSDNKDREGLYWGCRLCTHTEYFK